MAFNQFQLNYCLLFMPINTSVGQELLQHPQLKKSKQTGTVSHTKSNTILHTRFCEKVRGGSLQKNCKCQPGIVQLL